MPSIYGLGLPDLPEGAIPVDLVMLFKWVDEEGNVRYTEMKTERLHPIEALGMCSTAVDTFRNLSMPRGLPDV